VSYSRGLTYGLFDSTMSASHRANFLPT